MRASRATYRRSAKAAKSAALRVRPRPSDVRQGILRFGPHALPCALGRGAVSARKREGDGATPLGRLRLVCGYCRPRQARDLQPFRTRLPMRAAGPKLGWCDAAEDRNYNRPVRIPYPASHERMLREDGLYDACLVLDWNFSVRRRGRGSAIFLHLARPGFQPTEGCVAVPPGRVRALLARIGPGTRIVIG